MIFILSLLYSIYFHSSSINAAVYDFNNFVMTFFFFLLLLLCFLGNLTA
jgi:hypothetical protein